MRKAVSIISVCLVCLMLCLYVPIKGRAMSFNDEPLRYSVLQFDYLECQEYKIPYPFNFASQGTSFEPFEFGSLGIGGYVNIPDGYEDLYGYVNALFYDEFTLYSDLQVVRMYALNDPLSYHFVCGDVNMNFISAEISCSVVTLDDDWSFSNSVGALYNSVSGVLYPNANGSILLGQGLYDLLVANGYAGDSLLLLSDLTVNFKFNPSSDNTTPSVLLSAATSTFDPDLLFGQWVSELGIVVPDSSVDASGFNLGTWLANSVNGFIKAEIFPGFSIDKIFYIILVVGLLLWFFKVIS